MRSNDGTMMNGNGNHIPIGPSIQELEEEEEEDEEEAEEGAALHAMDADDDGDGHGLDQVRHGMIVPLVPPPLPERVAGGGGGGGGLRPGGAPNALQLIDEEEWYNRNGLRDEPYGQDSYTNQQEAWERVQQEQRYQKHVHKKFFHDHTKEEMSKLGERARQLNQWAGQFIELHTSPSSNAGADGVDKINGNNNVLKVNLKDLATHSDTVFAMATNRHLFTNDKIHNNSNDDDDDGMCLPPLSLSLLEYPKEAVEAFLDVLFQCEPKTTTTTMGPTVVTTATTTTTTATTTTTSTTATATTTTTNTATISPTSSSVMVTPPPDEYVVDCCRLAHYLQCPALLNDLVDTILLPSVDSDNCLSLCHLADQLGLPTLLEVSLNHMLSTVTDLEGQPIWDDLAPELQNKIQTIQQILISSNRRHVYFSSYSEYLALLAEQHQYYRERLDEALDQQRQNARVGTPAWTYAQQKIDQQAERVRTLNRFLMEQKRVFGNRTDGSNQTNIYNTVE